METWTYFVSGYSGDGNLDGETELFLQFPDGKNKRTHLVIQLCKTIQEKFG
jgi:hypothetical protein